VTATEQDTRVEDAINWVSPSSYAIYCKILSLQSKIMARA